MSTAEVEVATPAVETPVAEKARAKPKAPAGPKRAPVYKTAKAGIGLPVPRVESQMRKASCDSAKISDSTPVYITGGTDYLIKAIIKVAVEAAKDDGKVRITPRHIVQGLKNDADLDAFFKNDYISEGGVFPVVHDSLLSNKRRKKSRTAKKARHA